MKARKRLTREESKELTRLRLIEAAESLFIRRGFDDASVDEISEMAGYSRGAFYSNFDNKEQVFLAVIDRRRPKALDTFSNGCPNRRNGSPQSGIGSRINGVSRISSRSGWNSAARLLEIVPSGRISPNCFGRNSTPTPIPSAAFSARRTNSSPNGRRPWRLSYWRPTRTGHPRRRERSRAGTSVRRGGQPGFRSHDRLPTFIFRTTAMLKKQLFALITVPCLAISHRACAKPKLLPSRLPCPFRSELQPLWREPNL